MKSRILVSVIFSLLYPAFAHAVDISLIDRLIDHEEPVRVRAIQEVKDMKPEERARLIPALTQVLHEGRFPERACRALVGIRPEGVDVLINYLGFGKRGRNCAVVELQRMGKSILPQLESVLRGSDDDAIFNALRVIKKNGAQAKHLEEPLLLLTSHRDADIRADAAQIIESLKDVPFIRITSEPSTSNSEGKGELIVIEEEEWTEAP